MGKPTKQASGRGTSSRGKSAGRSSRSEGEVFAWISRSISGFFGHVSTNYRNRRIPVVLGLCLLAFMTVALFSVLTFLLSQGSDQSLIAPLAEGEVLGRVVGARRTSSGYLERGSPITSSIVSSAGGFSSSLPMPSISSIISSGVQGSES